MKNRRITFVVLLAMFVFGITVCVSAANKGESSALLISGVPSSNNDVAVMKKIISIHSVKTTPVFIKQYNSDNKKDKVNSVTWQNWIKIYYNR